jgi:hypothetical protein
MAVLLVGLVQLLHHVRGHDPRRLWVAAAMISVKVAPDVLARYPELSALDGLGAVAGDGKKRPQSANRV